jgi:beta-N-acetylhexosaminidase
VNPENKVIGDRSFGSDPAFVSECVRSYIKGLHDQEVLSSCKHFPGHGNTQIDSHKGYSSSDETMEEFQKDELPSFAAGIDAGADFIMAGHISFPAITGDDIPASLSRKMITEVLREQMGYDGIVITDSLQMGAITDRYSSKEAAVMALEAGCDMLLMPGEPGLVCKGVTDAVRSGRLSEDRIDESLRRILRVKLTIE